MSKVLAAVDNSAAARPVLAAAAAIAELLEAEVEGIHVREDGDRTARTAAEAGGVTLRAVRGPVIGALVRAAEQEDVAAIAVGARGTSVGRRPAGHVALELIVSVRKPVLVVPPQAPAPLALRQILVPLNGTRVTTAALASTIELARGSDVDVIVLHVHDHVSVPLFGEQPQHELEAWAREFLARHAPHLERVRLEVRTGIPAAEVLRVARDAEADLVALGWAQDLSEGRAAVVREVLERSEVPVLLVPVAVRERHEGAVERGRAPGATRRRAPSAPARAGG